jgi:predicted phosphodiesterase
MAKKGPTQIDLAGEYVRKYPNTPSLTLAKKIYAENTAMFLNVEAARSAVRVVRGAHGKALRSEIKDKSMFQSENRPYNPFEDLPQSDKIDRVPVKVLGSKILFLSDIHFPYHDEQALKLALEVGIKDEVDCIYLNGDILDFYQVSSFDRDPRKRRFKDEIEMGKQFLSILRREFPKAHIYYKVGNHEIRLWRYMKVKAPELLDLEIFSFEELLEFSKHNVHYVDGQTMAQIGSLAVFHGHEFGGSVFSPVNVARGLYLRAKSSAICGHSHQTSEHTERDVNGKVTTCWSVGCLSELSPDYAPYNKWNLGFARIDLDGDSFHIKNFRIHGGKIL